MGVPIALIALGAQAGLGYLKSRQAKKQAEKLGASRPVLPDSPYMNDDLSLAESELARGDSGGADDAYRRSVDSAVTTSVDALMKSGGSVNNIAEIFNSGAEGRNRMALMNDNIRLARINNLVRARQSGEQRSQQQFQFNRWAPWADQAQATAASRQGAEDQMWAGIEGFGAAATNMSYSPPGTGSGSGVDPEINGL